MTKQDVMDALQNRQPEQELRWMIDLGASLTVSARGYYPVEKRQGSLSHLVGFNELLHQVYGCIRQFGNDKEWTLDNFMDGLISKAEYYGISHDLDWALNAAISAMK